MTISKRHRLAGVVSGVAAVALTISACGVDDDDEPGGELEESLTDCANYESYGSFDGETVTIFSSIRDEEADQMTAAWNVFADCVGMTIAHEGVGEFESDIRVRVEGGNAPDIALFPQPGLMEQFSGDLIPATAEVQSAATEGWSEDILQYGTIDGTLYAPPHSVNAKSFVWYSPSFFSENNYAIPTTWDEMTTLTQTIVDDHGIQPWCVGFESGGATGWPGTDWIEDAMLRFAGPDVYDRWVNHEIPFNDPQVADAFDQVGQILLNEDYVNGGFGGVDTITATPFQEAGLPILDNECAMMRQASFYGAMWEAGTDVSENGEVFAFTLPAQETGDVPMLIGGEFVAAFTDNPAVEAVRQFLASPEYHNLRLQSGPWSTAHQGADPTNAANAINQTATELLQNPDLTARFDGSDLMPGEVGASSFWTGMIEWVGGKSTADVLNDIESSWPS